VLATFTAKLSINTGSSTVVVMKYLGVYKVAVEGILDQLVPVQVYNILEPGVLNVCPIVGLFGNSTAIMLFV
jgi:hypothetical protein